MSPGEKRLRAGWRLLGQSILFIALFFGFGMVAIYIPGINLSGFSLIAQFISFLAITISVFIARKLLDRRSIKSLGLSLNWLAAGDLIAGLIISGLMMGLVFIIEWMAGWLTIDGFAWQKIPVSQIIPDIIYMLAFFILTGWQEELSSRGYQLQNLADGLNLLWGVLLSSAGFALLHLANPSMSLMAIIGLLVSGLFMAYGYVVTRQLWLPIGIHIGWNFMEGPILGFQVSGYSDMPRLIYHTVKGNPLITGGEFGPEAGLVLLPAVIVGFLLVYLYTRERNLNAFST